jgi:DNA primase
MLKEISENIDLVEYIGQYIDLIAKGKEYFGHCFRHADKTPSLSVNPIKNRYYCHSCGVGGGIIGFLMEYEKLSFEESVEKASRLANVDLSTMCKSQTVIMLKKISNTNKVKEIYEHKIFDKNLLNNYSKIPIVEWLEEGIRQEEIDLYEIMIDNDSNRIIYPVYDIHNNLINIKGRTRFKDYKSMKLPKYINYFTVGVMDYFQGLNISLNDIKDSGEFIIFESIKSVMKLRKYGKKNSASAEKHTLTDEQIKLLIQLHVDIVLAFDTDVSYNDKEIKESIDILKKFTNVYVINDRDSLLGGAEAKSSPVDIDKQTWDILYKERVRIR